MRPTLTRLAVIVPATVLLALAGATPVLAAPAITTTMTGDPTPKTATDGATVDMSDTVTVTSNTAAPTGTIDFNFFDNSTCTGPEKFGGSATLTPGSGMVSTATFTKTGWVAATGTYYWRATYATADANNVPASTACNDAAQKVVVSPAAPPAKAKPTITGQANPQDVMEGKQVTITDTATLHGANDPTGDIYFALFDNDNCDPDPTTGEPVLEGFAPVNPATGKATFSVTVTPEGAGPYYWWVAYEGDANNEGAEELYCDDSEQLLMVALNPDNEPQEPGPLTPVSDTGGDNGGGAPELPRTGAPPVVSLSLMGLGFLMLGVALMGFGRMPGRVAAR